MTTIFTLTLAPPRTSMQRRVCAARNIACIDAIGE